MKGAQKKKLDPEILQVFREELVTIELNLKDCIIKLIKAKMNDSSHYSRYGQVIDRVYGTANTLGLTELGEYSKEIKEVCYRCSESQSDRAREKVLRLMITCLAYIEEMGPILEDEGKMKTLYIKMKREMGRIHNLKRSSLFGIDRESCD